MQVDIQPSLRPDRCHVVLKVDGRPKVVLKDLHKATADVRIMRQLVGMLRKYVNHRQRIMLKHGGYCTSQKLNAVNKCLNRLDLSAAWTPKAFRKFLQLMEDDLISILPSYKSKFFHNDSQFVFDLLTWAKPTIQSSAS